MSDFKSLNDGLLLNLLCVFLIIIYCVYMAMLCYVNKSFLFSVKYHETWHI